MRECTALLHNIILQDNVNDVRRWSLDPIHGYSVWEAYHFLTTYGEPEEGNLAVNIWHKYIPSKVILFLWRLLRDRLPTKDNLVRRRVWQVAGLRKRHNIFFLDVIYSALLGLMCGIG